jgi:sulfur-oxidizing protein SoxX
MSRSAFVLAILTMAAAPAVFAQESLQPYAVRGDAIDLPLTGRPGDPARGEALLADQRRSLCLLCHAGPFPESHAQGTLAPDLRGVGGRLSEGQLRLRVVDMKQLDPTSIMPSYYRTDGLSRVAKAWRGKPVLTAEEIEDAVAFLVTLKD